MMMSDDLPNLSNRDPEAGNATAQLAATVIETSVLPNIDSVAMASTVTREALQGTTISDESEGEAIRETAVAKETHAPRSSETQPCKPRGRLPCAKDLNNFPEMIYHRKVCCVI